MDGLVNGVSEWMEWVTDSVGECIGWMDGCVVGECTDIWLDG